MQIVPLTHSLRGLRRLTQLSDLECSLTEHQKELLRQRLEVLTYLHRHGGDVSEVSRLLGCSRRHTTEIRDAYGSGGLPAIVPRRSGPQGKRGSQLPSVTKECIEDIAHRHLPYGYRKIAVLLSWYGHQSSASAVYDYLREKHLLRHQRCPRKPDRHRLKKGQKRVERLRRPEGHSALRPGDLVALDSITEFVMVAGKQEPRYVITAIDLATEIGIALCVPHLTSRWAARVLAAMQDVLRVPIVAVLTDNGSEFLAQFQRDCQEGEIVHYFTRPRTPEQNGVVERFNQTVQDECLYLTDLRRSRGHLNAVLCGWLVHYNLTRPHQTLRYRPPVAQYVHLLTPRIGRPEVLPRLWSSTPS